MIKMRMKEARSQSVPNFPLNILHSGFYWRPWGVETWKFCDYFTVYICHEGPEAWGFPLTNKFIKHDPVLLS